MKLFFMVKVLHIQTKRNKELELNTTRCFRVCVCYVLWMAVWLSKLQ